ncbi:MAG TPA: DUF1643 domain-containing protein, partial [Candidatus Limnocylindrales bacterium]
MRWHRCWTIPHCTPSSVANRPAPDAMGPANDEVLRVITKAGAQTIAAWGTRGRLHERSGQVGP